MTTVAVIQSNYIPWKGYFDIIHDADLFIFYDDVQFTKNDWRNRNKIKTQAGAAWITIPVGQDENRLISDVVIPDKRWAEKHWKTIQQNYGRAPHFSLYAEFLEETYLGMEWRNLSELNQSLIRRISKFLGIQTRFDDSKKYTLAGRKTERLIDLLKQSGATRYISGPAARDYLRPQEMSAAGIELVYKEYGGYPEYGQFFPPFDHYVSIIDLLMHTGENAGHHIWGWRDSIIESRKIR